MLFAGLLRRLSARFPARTVNVFTARVVSLFAARVVIAVLDLVVNEFSLRPVNSDCTPLGWNTLYRAYDLRFMLDKRHNSLGNRNAVKVLLRSHA
jgi:hypothetical protein